LLAALGLNPKLDQIVLPGANKYDEQIGDLFEISIGVFEMWCRNE
jgi:hypothetical protein